MGYYHGLALHLKFKKDIPEQVKEFLDVAFNERDIASLVDTDKMLIPLKGNIEYDISDISSRLYGSGCYISGWIYSVFTFMDNLDCYVVELRSSSKGYNTDMITDILKAFLPYLQIADGDVLASIIGEDEYREHVFWFNSATSSFTEEYGYYFGDKWDNFNHPASMYRSEFNRCSEKAWMEIVRTSFITEGYSALGFIPPLNIEELRKINIQRTDSSTIKNDSGAYGF